MKCYRHDEIPIECGFSGKSRSFLVWWEIGVEAAMWECGNDSRYNEKGWLNRIRKVKETDR